MLLLFHSSTRRTFTPVRAEWGFAESCIPWRIDCRVLFRWSRDPITASPPQRPDEPVLIPGDPERISRAERIKNGVPVDDETWRELTVAARGVNVLVEAPAARPG
jgi:hypothetical protein